MIKSIVLVKRRPGLTREQFSKYWREVHAELAKRSPEVTLHMRKYVQNHRICLDSSDSSPAPADATREELAQPAGPSDFDGIFEGWFENAEEMRKAFDNPTYLGAVVADENQFIDKAKCVAFIVDEYVVFDEAHRPAGEALANKGK